jgi:hypothetical protein
MPLFQGPMDQQRIAIHMSKQASLRLCLATAFADLGRGAEAREAAARLLGVDPPSQSLSSSLAAGDQTRSC